MTGYKVDLSRAGMGETGILVRAQRQDGRWDSVDIVELDAASLREWLRSRGGDNPWAESVVAMLLGHPT